MSRLPYYTTAKGVLIAAQLRNRNSSDGIPGIPASPWSLYILKRTVGRSSATSLDRTACDVGLEAPAGIRSENGLRSRTPRTRAIFR